MPILTKLLLAGFCLLLSTTGGESLVAQSPRERVELAAFRDSLARLSDMTVLSGLEAELIARARKDRDNAMLHLRLGLVALRLGSLAPSETARRHYDDAGGEFEWAVQEQPEWPWGWYGLGLAELAVGNAGNDIAEGFQTMLGRDALTRSANAFARSAEVDPEFVEGLVELSNTALRQRINARMDVALAALRRSGRSAVASHPQILLARGRVERDVGSLDSSAVALNNLLSADSTSAVARYELARTLFLLDDSQAGPLWYRGLAAADSATLALILDDISLIASDSIMAVMANAEPGERVATMQHFWTSREDRALQPAGSRLVEHYRRLATARRSYRLVSENRQFGITETYRSGQVEYDDRGIIYIRHGEPDNRAQYQAPGIEPNETWQYLRDGRNLLFHFVARQDVQDFRLVESLFDILGFAEALAIQGQEAGDNALMRHTDGLLLSRESMHPVYGRLMAAGRSSVAQYATEERELGRRAIRFGTTSDSWPVRFEKAILPVNTRVLVLGSVEDVPTVIAAFAIGVDAVKARMAEDRPGYPVRIRAALQTLGGSTVASLDTTRMFSRSAGNSLDEWLFGFQQVPVEAGMFTARVLLETEQGGFISSLDTVRVADPSGTLAISDLAIGVRGSSAPWLGASGDTAWIDPTGEFELRTPLQLYAEVTGMPHGGVYRVEIAVMRARGGSIFRRIFGGGTAFSVAFDQAHPGGTHPILRELDLSRLDAGEYTLRVTITNKADHDQEVVRNRSFELID